MSVAHNLTERGARRLADMIAEYWRERGYRVKVEIMAFQSENPDLKPPWVVRSDLVNGLPRDYRGNGTDLPHPEPARREPQERPCLRCGRPMLSEHAGNRLCGYCGERDETVEIVRVDE